MLFNGYIQWFWRLGEAASHSVLVQLSWIIISGSARHQNSDHVGLFQRSIHGLGFSSDPTCSLHDAPTGIPAMNSWNHQVEMGITRNTQTTVRQMNEIPFHRRSLVFRFTFFPLVPFRNLAQLSPEVLILLWGHVPCSPLTAETYQGINPSLCQEVRRMVPIFQPC